MALAGRVVLVTGGSRGIGLAIAKRCAQDGAKIVLAAKTVEPHKKLAGTIIQGCEECEAAGAQGTLAVQTDIRDDNAVENMIDQTVSQCGGIDILINNASAIDNRGTLEIDAKKYELMHGINGRGTFWTSKLALPHLLKGTNPHVLNLSPPLDLDPRWFKIGGIAYTMAKYNMSMSALGMAEEFRGQVAFNCLWPRNPIATAAVESLMGTVGMKASRTVDIMSDAAHWILTQPVSECTGNTFIDTDVMTDKVGMTESELGKYRVSSFVPLMPDLYVGDPTAMEKYVDTARSMASMWSSSKK